LVAREAHGEERDGRAGHVDVAAEQDRAARAGEPPGERADRVLIDLEAAERDQRGQRTRLDPGPESFDAGAGDARVVPAAEEGAVGAGPGADQPDVALAYGRATGDDGDAWDVEVDAPSVAGGLGGASVFERPRISSALPHPPPHRRYKVRRSMPSTLAASDLLSPCATRTRSV
jgi:hypothetical protein